jgi:ATP-dependent helicase/nuclease subunit B
LGYSAPSPYRALLQLLPLSFALAWEPPDPGRLLDFLLLPLGPLPRSAANRLAEVVAKSPGVGGEEWNEAWAKIGQDLAEAEGADAGKVAARLSEWREFVEPERHDPAQGMTRASARRIAEKVSAWAVKRAGASDDPLFFSLAEIAADLATAIAATEANRLDRVLIERMLEEAVGAGVADPAAVAEASPWRAVRHPGAIWGAAGTVVWWHFADLGETGSRTIWNKLERVALAEAGCPLDEPDLALRRLSAAWERPLQFAQRIILVRPTLAAGAETAAHPLWHTLVAQRDSLESETTVRAEVILGESEPTLIGRKLVRSPVALVPAPEPRTEWTAPEATIRPRPAESATSLSALLSCPLQWTLRYAGKLYPSARQSLPDIDALMGTLAHRIAEEVFCPGGAPEPETVETAAKARLTELLPQIAATLLLPGAAGELAAVKVAIPLALAELARFLRSKKLTVVAVEHPFAVAGALDANTEVRGYIDLLAKTPDGRFVVIDLKWQRRDSRRRAELENGLALQLAVYARHVSDENVDVETGYFMLRQRRFLTTGLLDGEATLVLDGATPKETCDRIAVSWKATMKEMRGGKVRATFEHADESLADFEDAHLLLPPSCVFCDYAGICGVGP